jgi:hypothetical protein
VRRQASVLLVAVGGLAVAALLPLPNVAVATGFVSGEHPTAVAALAATELMIWVVLLVGVVVVLARALGNVRFRVLSAPVLVGVVLALSLTVLGVGVARHSSNQYSMCCGSISQARQQLGNAP